MAKLPAPDAAAASSGLAFEASVGEYECPFRCRDDDRLVAEVDRVV